MNLATVLQGTTLQVDDDFADLESRLRIRSQHLEQLGSQAVLQHGRVGTGPRDPNNVFYVPSPALEPLFKANGAKTAQDNKAQEAQATLKNGRKEVLQQASRRELPPSADPYADRIRREVQDAGVPRGGLDTTRRFLSEFYEDRIHFLLGTERMIMSRVSRYFVNPFQLAAISPALQYRLALLQRELEMCYNRVQRLRPILPLKDGAMNDEFDEADAAEHAPVAVTNIGQQLFVRNELYEGGSGNGLMSSIQRGDITVASRVLLSEEEVTRPLQRYICHLRLLPLQKRHAVLAEAALALRALQLQDLQKQNALLCLPLKVMTRKMLSSKLQKLRDTFGIATALHQDRGHAFAHEVLGNFPLHFARVATSTAYCGALPAEEGGTVLDEEEEAMLTHLLQMKSSVSPLRELASVASPASKPPEIISDMSWVPYVGLRPHIPIETRERRAAMQEVLTNAGFGPPKGQAWPTFPSARKRAARIQYVFFFK